MPGTSSETVPALVAPAKPQAVKGPFDHDSASIIPRAAALATPETTASTSSSASNHSHHSSSSPSAISPKAEALKQFVADDRHFSLVRNFRLADLVTIGNGICGSLSIMCCGNYLATKDREYLWYVFIYIIIFFFSPRY